MWKVVGPSEAAGGWAKAERVGGEICAPLTAPRGNGEEEKRPQGAGVGSPAGLEGGETPTNPRRRRQVARQAPALPPSAGVRCLWGTWGEVGTGKWWGPV